MIQDILNFLKEIGNYFVALWEFVVGLIQDTLYVLKLLTSLPLGIEKIEIFFAWLPPSVVVFLFGMLCVAIIFKILGREG